MARIKARRSKPRASKRTTASMQRKNRILREWEPTGTDLVEGYKKCMIRNLGRPGMSMATKKARAVFRESIHACDKEACIVAKTIIHVAAFPEEKMLWHPNR